MYRHRFAIGLCDAPYFITGFKGLVPGKWKGSEMKKRWKEQRMDIPNIETSDGNEHRINH